MFNGHHWKGDEVVINNDLEKNIKVNIYHGDKLVGVVDNETTFTNVRAQIRQKFHDETSDGQHDMENWHNYYAEWNGNKILLSGFGGMEPVNNGFLELPFNEMEVCLNMILGI